MRKEKVFIRFRLRTYLVLFVCCLLLFLAGCEEEVALEGNDIIPPADSEITYDGSVGGFDQSAAPLEFQVVGADGITPTEGVQIRFFGGSQTVALAHRDGINIFGSPQNFLNKDDPLFFETETDERGLSPVDIFAVWEVPPCKADLTDPNKPGPDTTVTATVTATLGVASKTWTLTINVKGGTQTEGCVPST